MLYVGLALTLYVISERINLIWTKFDYKIRKIHAKISFECRVYESVNDRNLSLIIFQKSTKAVFRQKRANRPNKVYKDV